MKNISTRLMLIASFLWMSVAFGSLQDAQRMFEQGRHDAALTEVDKLLAAQPAELQSNDAQSEDAKVRFLKGLIYAEKGDKDRAVEVFAGLTQDYPELPEPWNNLAVLFAENGEFDKARESLLAAIQTHPSYSTAHENLGDLYARMAGMAYDQALEQDRANESARLKLSAVNGLFSAPRSITAATNPQVVASNNTRPPEPIVTQNNPPPRTETAPSRPPIEIQPEPVVTEPEPAVTSNVSAEVQSAVRSWASAWSGKNVDGYLARYSRSFRPSNGASFGAWSRYRSERLTKPKIIEVDVSQMRVNQINDSTATATFRQKYRSDNYRDEVTKVLTLTNEAGQWLIVSEVSE